MSNAANKTHPSPSPPNNNNKQVCMQGGIHPSFTGDTYLAILQAAKRGAPGLHVHAFSPLEVTQVRRVLLAARFSLYCRRQPSLA
jgi:hypothetical protein